MSIIRSRTFLCINYDLVFKIAEEKKHLHSSSEAGCGCPGIGQTSFLLSIYD